MHENEQSHVRTELYDPIFEDIAAVLDAAGIANAAVTGPQDLIADPHLKARGFWQDHMDRLAIGCERLGMKAPQQAILLREVQTVSVGKSRCVVKITLTRAPGTRGYAPVMDGEPRRMVSSHTWPAGIEAAASRGVQASMPPAAIADSIPTTEI